jgi:hypothetical protein
MRIRLLSLSFAVALFVAALTPTVHAEALPASSYAPAQPHADDLEPWDFAGVSETHRGPFARQVSGLPWSRVWMPRNILRNRGR